MKNEFAEDLKIKREFEHAQRHVLQVKQFPQFPKI